MFIFDVNFGAIIVATIVNILLGMGWYSRDFLGKKWAEAHQFKISDLKAEPPQYLGAILVSLITVWVFALLIHWFSIKTVGDGVLLAFLIWLGFIATTHFSGVLWAKKNLRSYFIDIGFQLVSMVVMGIILSAWQ